VCVCVCACVCVCVRAHSCMCLCACVCADHIDSAPRAGSLHSIHYSAVTSHTHTHTHTQLTSPVCHICMHFYFILFWRIVLGNTYVPVCSCVWLEFTDDEAETHDIFKRICVLVLMHWTVRCVASVASVSPATVTIRCSDSLLLRTQSSTSEYRFCSSASPRHRVSPLEHLCRLLFSSRMKCITHIRHTAISLPFILPFP